MLGFTNTFLRRKKGFQRRRGRKKVPWRLGTEDCEKTGAAWIQAVRFWPRSLNLCAERSSGGCAWVELLRGAARSASTLQRLAWQRGRQNMEWNPASSCWLQSEGRALGSLCWMRKQGVAWRARWQKGKMPSGEWIDSELNLLSKIQILTLEMICGFIEHIFL